MASLEIQFNEPGMLTQVDITCGRVLTNVSPSSLCPPAYLLVDASETLPLLKVSMDEKRHFRFTPEEWDTAYWSGFFDIPRGRRDISRKGKFVYMKRGAFFLSPENVPHLDLPRLIGSADRVAVLSAGFIHLRPDGIELFGHSVGLNLLPYSDGDDADGIATHLELPRR